jgi:hypothetical protein
VRGDPLATPGNLGLGGGDDLVARGDRLVALGDNDLGGGDCRRLRGKLTLEPRVFCVRTMGRERARREATSV